MDNEMITITATDVKQHFGKCLDLVIRSNEPIVIEKYKKPFAGIMTYEEFQRLNKIENNMLIDKIIKADDDYLSTEESNAFMENKINNIS